MSDQFLDDFKDDSKSAIEEVMEYVTTLQTLDNDIEAIEQQLKDKQAIRDEIAKETLPALLAENGLDEMKLSNGMKLTIKEDVFVSVPKNDEGKKKVLEWLKANGGEDLVHQELTVEGPSEWLRQTLKENECVFEEEIAVNTNSLKAWFKRQLGMTKGSIQSIDLNQVPKEANLYVERRAVIK